MAAVSTIAAVAMVATSAYGLYSSDKARSDAKKEQKDLIAKEQQEALKVRKETIDKQRMQLLGDDRGGGFKLNPTGKTGIMGGILK